jgi:lysophospholipase L1-like esterase
MKVYVAARRGMHDAFPAKGDYAMLGDSITAEMPWREAFPEAAVVNLGIAGDTTTGVLDRLDTVMATGAKTIVLLIGINDLQLHRAAPADVAERHAEILRRLVATGIQVVAVSLFTGYSDLRDRVAAVNARLKRSCSSPPQCIFLDLNAALSDDGLLKPAYTYDGIHLNADGYKVWVRNLSGLIK